jgi:hypothetical protein
MRRLSIAAVAAVLVVLAAGAAAYAANVYDLPDASTTPKGSGSPARPLPVGVNFDFTVKDEAGPRGAPVKSYKIAFQGLTHRYAKRFPTCRYADTTVDGPLSQVQAACRRAMVGTGRIETLVAIENVPGTNPPVKNTNPNSVQAFCNLQLTLYNLGYGLAIRLDADNTTLPQSQSGPFGCIVPTHRSIQARFAKVRIGGVPSSSLNFDVFQELRHNAGFVLTVARVTSTVDRKRKRVRIGSKRRQVGLYSSIACGKRNRRTVQVTFTDENGVSTTASRRTRC